MPFIRVFTSEPDLLQKYFNFLRLETKDKHPLAKVNYEIYDPFKWVPDTSFPTVSKHSVINIFVDFPVQLAIPFGNYNVFAFTNTLDEWKWTETSMDSLLDKDLLLDRKTALHTIREIIRTATHKKHGVYDVSNTSALPTVAVITDASNVAEGWWKNMVQNITTQKYDRAQLTWVISARSEIIESLHKVLTAFRSQFPDINVKVVTETDINIITKALASDMFMIMCAEHHYPINSIMIRSTWLNGKGSLPNDKNEFPSITHVHCSTMPTFDITKCVSSIHVPDLCNSPEERICKASLAWKPSDNLSSCSFSVEIPPTGVIVMFDINVSKESPNGCHYGFSDEYFTYVQKLGNTIKPRNMR